MISYLSSRLETKSLQMSSASTSVPLMRFAPLSCLFSMMMLDHLARFSPDDDDPE